MNNEATISEANRPALPSSGSVYFLGIGGIGMSALARYFNVQGLKVSGYDKTPTPLTTALQEEGITVHFSDDVEGIDKEASLVIFTPAIPSDHKGLTYFRNNNYPLWKRSDVLGMITSGKYSICIAGTHGKTTTSAMVAHILRDSGHGCNAFLGGIATNYNTNFWASKNNVCVAEADEYDRSFLKLSPDIAIITSMDADHLDIYGTAEKMRDAFIEFSDRIKRGGVLIYRYGLERSEDLRGDKKISYSLTDARSDARAENIQIANGAYKFDIIIKNHRIAGLELSMGGRHNIENSVACITAAHYAGISDENIKKAVRSFEGVKRRFEYIVRNGKTVMIDDYAHHPEELRALIAGAKELYPDRKCTVVFQPHLFSRTRDLAPAFGEVLDMADEVILLPIYPAREEPIDGVTSETIALQMRSDRTRILSKEQLVQAITNESKELLIMAGAGDIDALIEPISELVRNYK